MSITVSGSVSKAGDPNDPLSIPVFDPGVFFASTCRTSLTAKGIRVNGEMRRVRVRLADGSLPQDLEVIATHESRLGDFLWRVNKSSQNLFAEALLKSVGTYTDRCGEHVPGSYEAGRAAVREFLTSIDAKQEGVVIDDGSGLSHSNRVTPAVLTAVLRHMDRHGQRSLWWSSLAVPGEQVGTLRKRMVPLEGSVFAKTGYIGGVSALSGYVVGPGQRGYAFSVLCNDTGKAKGGTTAARKLQDSICELLASWEPKSDAVGG
jgi:D-alanyl-D-alanine carboxypeptidase/D-alanyl-D-alanine-endopeptidase (penicillin-binding protein 4)